MFTFVVNVIGAPAVRDKVIGFDPIWEDESVLLYVKTNTRFGITSVAARPIGFTPNAC